MRPVSLKLIYSTLFAAYMLYLLPWAGFGLLLRPDFVLLVLLYWMLRAPHLCNVGTAWMMGLWLDVASGSLFGQYALAYTVTAFFAIYYQRRLVLFSAWQQVGYVLLLLLVSQIVLLVIKLMAGNPLPGWGYFLSSLSGVLLWQLLVFSRVIDAKNAS
ncbi:MAG TPA: rod shape-determining protein MreD [Methylophilaceae bacterium]|jgi:rod shape-determining protein MreD|nr:rod shape-determining protein MreD [Methylophilaceae bacterium]